MAHLQKTKGLLLLASAHVFTGRNIAFLGSAYHIALARFTRRLWWFALRGRQGQNTNLAIFTIRIAFAFFRCKRDCR